MQIEYDSELLYVKCGGAQFNDQLESCKMMGMRYDPDKRAWTISAGKFNELVDEMNQYSLEISEYDKKAIADYFNNMKELKQTKRRSEYRKFDQSLLKISPL